MTTSKAQERADGAAGLQDYPQEFVRRGRRAGRARDAATGPGGRGPRAAGPPGPAQVTQDLTGEVAGRIRGPYVTK